MADSLDEAKAAFRAAGGVSARGAFDCALGEAQGTVNDRLRIESYSRRASSLRLIRRPESQPID